MENINPQYTFDNMGNPIGVFLPIEDWNTITQELQLDLPQWQKDMIDISRPNTNSNIPENRAIYFMLNPMTSNIPKVISNIVPIIPSTFAREVEAPKFSRAVY